MNNKIKEKGMAKEAEPKEKKVSPIGESLKTADCKAKLKQCEDIIRQNENGPFITGRNLATINDEALYKSDGLNSFDEYCRMRWGMSDKHAYRLIKAAKCLDLLAKQDRKNWVLPRNESQIRRLALMPEAKWVGAWEKVMKKFHDKPFTAEDVEAVLFPGEEAEEPQTNSKANPIKKLETKLETIKKWVNDALKNKDDKPEQVRKLLEKIKGLITGKK